MTTKRLALVDALRGLALFAILLANIPHNETIHGPADQMLNAIFHLLIDKKFVAIFSMLFGFGFYIQIQHAEEKGYAFRRYFLVRMLLLLLIGCLHAYLLWFGDIIRDYAIGGIFLLFIYKWPARRILVTGIILIGFLTPVIFILNGVLELQTYDFGSNYVARHPVAASYSEYLEINFRIDPFRNFIQDSPLTLVFSLGGMLIGFWMAKTGFFHTPERFNKVLNRLIIIGIIAGLTCSYIFWKIITGELELTPDLIWLPFVIVSGLFLQSLFYISVFIKLYRFTWIQKATAGFRVAGSMALTNYIMQSVFYILCFFHFSGGLKLYGKFSYTETWLFAVFIFIVQIILSRLWLKFFEQGPIEWVWKKLAKIRLRPRQFPGR